MVCHITVTIIRLEKKNEEELVAGGVSASALVS
jgi:hypothetical protein